MAAEAPPSQQTFPVNYKGQAKAHCKSAEDREKIYKQSIKDPATYWSEFAKKNIDWQRPFDQPVVQGSFADGDIAWFTNGKLNLCWNAVDRWAKMTPNNVAILWEGDTPDQVRKITFKELQKEVCRVANMFIKAGVKKGDRICIYMPMMPETAFVMLACTRIGAPHSVIFAGFSSEAIRSRVNDATIEWVCTADQGCRGGKTTNLKEIVDDGIKGIDFVRKCFVWKRTGNKCNMEEGRDVYVDTLLPNERPYCPCAVMDSEDPLFILYTSGSTGTPKGVVHTTAGYLAYTMATHRYVFDIHPGDVYACVADVGWITGHSYIVYGPLANGATTLMFESTPVFPDPGRYWDMVQRHKITQFYTAPTAIRLLQKFDATNPEYVTKYDRSSLRIIGTVGEPINPEAWLWYYNVVGEKQCPIVDTYWQTETGGIMITPLPGATPTKPGAATLPFFGIDYAILDNDGKEITGNDVEGILAVKAPWPSMARTVYNNHERYLNTYFRAYPGYYFTGDGAKRDKDGYYMITGRVDDVIITAGHNIGTAELEASVVEVPDIVEAACVQVADDVKGYVVFAYVVASKDGLDAAKVTEDVKAQVAQSIGKFARPKFVLMVNGVPKTRSGKVMRRLLRKIGEEQYDALGDVTTLANSDIVQHIIERRKAM